MPPSLRPYSARSEPSFAPAAHPEPLRAVEPRAAANRPAQPRPAPALRFPDDGRRAGEPGLRLEAADRVVVSSALAGTGKREGGLFGAVAMAALFFLAAIGALSLYHGFATHLLP